MRKFKRILMGDKLSAEGAPKVKEGKGTKGKKGGGRYMVIIKAIGANVHNMRN
jgi:hypothetical protein